MSKSLRPHGLKPTRILCPWNFPGKNTGVGCHFLLQRIFRTQRLNPGALCLLHWLAVSLPLCHLGTLSSSPTEPNFMRHLKEDFLSCNVCVLCVVSRSDVSDSLRPHGFNFPLWSSPGSSVRGILQARILEWVAISFSGHVIYLEKKKKQTPRNVWHSFPVLTAATSSSI